MDYLKYIFYGFIQGLTEFLPISSTAHLKVISLFFGLEDPGSSLSAVIQLGSVLAIFWYFREDFLSFFKSDNEQLFERIFSNRLNKSILLGTSSILFIGAFVKIYVPDFTSSFIRSNSSIGFISIIMAFVMLASEKYSNKGITISNHTFNNSFLIGLSQSLAIIPGVSRSGITISVAMLLGWGRVDAAKFSFLLGIPAITVAALVEFVSSFNSPTIILFKPLLLGLISAFITSLLSLDFLIKYIKLRGLRIFVYYRLFFGMIILSGYL